MLSNNSEVILKPISLYHAPCSPDWESNGHGSICTQLNDNIPARPFPCETRRPETACCLGRSCMQTPRVRKRSPCLGLNDAVRRYFRGVENLKCWLNRVVKCEFEDFDYSLGTVSGRMPDFKVPPASCREVHVFVRGARSEVP